MLLWKGAKWQWDHKHKVAWIQAKQALAAAPVVGHPEQGKTYYLYTDISDIAIGASLQQIQPIVLSRYSVSCIT